MRGSVLRLGNPDKKVLANWLRLLGRFVSREWMTVFVSFGAGTLLAAFFRLGGSDHSFRAFLKNTYVPTGLRFDDPDAYVRFLIVASAAVLLCILLDIPHYIWRGLKSWWAGVTSGLTLLTFACTVVFLVHSPSMTEALWSIAKYVGASSLAGYLLFLKAHISAKRTVSEKEFLVPSHKRRTAAVVVPESDDPIESWEEDALGRAALVDRLCVKLLISKSPVIALFGPLGVGKTSTLNLLREHLADKAIVISFSTWLPGSQETLTAYLMSDIASQVRKRYVVPGLRKGARRTASALGKTVPLLQSLTEALPATTQKDDIEELKAALSRLPERVVVLLDEIDRMEKDEVLTLLKIIRGISTLPNLSFVCAGDRETIITTVKGKFDEESIEYFEKFFPVTLPVPEPNPEALQKAGIERLVHAFGQRDWFNDDADENGFRTRLEPIWRERIAPFCRNLRAIGLLANDVSVAAAPLRREVDPIDLVLVQILQRFKPQVFELISQNSPVLTGGESFFRGGQYQTDQEKAATEKTFLSHLEAAVPSGDLETVKGVLREMFPRFSKIEGQSWTPRIRPAETKSDGEKRISEAGIFPAYFRYELPTAIFSSVELDSLLHQIEISGNEDTRRRTFQHALESMERGSLKRDDFLRKVAEAAGVAMSLSVGKSIVHAIARNADKLVYDTMAPFAEAGHALRIIIRVADRMPQSEKKPLLASCILETTDDTLAWRVLKYVTGKHDDFDLGVSFADLYPSFIQRMRTRYGREVDVESVDLTKADPIAFDLWAHQSPGEGVTADPEDRAMQRDFWIRHIGHSRRRLAQDFRIFILPESFVYSQDPTPSVDNKIPIATLKGLYESLPDDGIAADEDRRSLRNLERLFNGDFKNGIGPGMLFDE